MIAYTMAPGRGDTDLLLQDVARDLAAQGHSVCGTVQINTERDADGPCDMDVQVLPNGPVLRISQSLGRDAKGCRLDPEALETAVAMVAANLQNGSDLLIVNKFGKHEANGRGFRTVIADAIAQGVPVLVGVNALNADSFKSFAGPDAVQLSPDGPAITDWMKGVQTAP